MSGIPLVKVGQRIATRNVKGVISAPDKTKLDGIATGATANSTDAQLRDRATHTGTQTVNTITGLGSLATKSTIVESDISGDISQSKISGLISTIDSVAIDNIILNPEHQVAQSGTSFVSVANIRNYTLDQWVLNISGTATFTVSQDTNVPTLAQSGVFSPRSLRVLVNTAQATLTANNLGAITQSIEGHYFQFIAQQPFTISFWVRATIPGIYCVAARSRNSTVSCVIEYTINAANTWEKKIVVFPATIAAQAAWDYANNTGIIFSWAIGAGSTFITPTLNTWITGNFVASPNQVNGYGAANNEFRLHLCKCEPGLIATPFKKRLIDAQLRDCQRYYSRLHLGLENYATAGFFLEEWYLLPWFMRVAPTAKLVSTVSRDATNMSGTPGVVLLGQAIQYYVMVATTGNISSKDLWEFDARL